MRTTLLLVLSLGASAPFGLTSRVAHAGDAPAATPAPIVTPSGSPPASKDAKAASKDTKASSDGGKDHGDAATDSKGKRVANKVRAAGRATKRGAKVGVAAAKDLTKGARKKGGKVLGRVGNWLSGDSDEQPAAPAPAPDKKAEPEPTKN